MRKENPEYAITGVRYKDDQIEAVSVSTVAVKEDGTYLKKIGLKTRKWVYKMIASYHFVTAPPSNDPEFKYKKGARVHRTSNGYIRTDSNNIQSDNLGNLPEF